MPRLLAMVALFLAVIGLALSPAAACHVNAQPMPAKAAVQSPCHDAAEAPAEFVPEQADAKACCKTMCAPALPAIASGMDVHVPVQAHRPRSASRTACGIDPASRQATSPNQRLIVFALLKG
jgi:hypothetical protein